MRALLISCFLIVLMNNVIGQSFHWAKAADTSGAQGTRIQHDRNGNLIMSGIILNSSVDVDFGPAVVQLTSGIGNNNAYVAKYNPAGNLIWAKLFFVQNFNNRIEDIRLDSNNNIYILGYFKGTVDFDPGPGIFIMTNNNQGGFDQLFIEKLDENGNFVWAEKIGDTLGYTYIPSAMAIDQQGALYITSGFRNSIDFDPGPGTSTLTAPLGTTNSFLLKIDTSGQFIWVRQLEGAENTSKAVVCDRTHHIYLVGKYDSIIDADPNVGVYPLAGTGNHNVYTLKLDSSGIFLWAKTIFTPPSNPMADIIISSACSGDQNSLYTGGYFLDSMNFAPQPMVDIHLSNGSTDAFLTKTDSNGNHLWTRTFGGVAQDQCRGMTLDPDGHILLTGFFSGLVDFDPAIGGNYYLSAAQSVSNHGFISKFDTAGQFIRALQMGTALPVIGYLGVVGISCDSLSDIYITGSFTNLQDFNPGAGVYNLYNPLLNNGRVYLAKVSICGQHFASALSACDSATLWGTSYDSSSQFVQLFSDMNGCDSNISVSLTINHSSADTLHVNRCTEYTLNGITYTTGGFHVQTYSNAIGCDSLLVLDLVLLNNGNSSIVQSLDTLQVFPSGFSYQWIDCNSNTVIQGATSSIFVPAYSGTFKAVIHYSAECSDTTACRSISVGIDEQHSVPFSIVPNPGTGLFRISPALILADVSITIFDARGIPVKCGKEAVNEAGIIDLSAYPSGIYQLKVLHQKHTGFYRITKL